MSLTVAVQMPAEDRAGLNTVDAEPVRIRDMTSILTNASGPTLTRFLITCPSCQRTSAVHTHQSTAGRPIVVRVVCASEWAPDLAAVIDLLATEASGSRLRLIASALRTRHTKGFGRAGAIHPHASLTVWSATTEVSRRHRA